MPKSLTESHPHDKPVLPNRENLEDEYGRDYPDEEQTLSMLASGTTLIASVLMGLKSFHGTGHLFGALGRTLENPMAALSDFLNRARGLMKTGATDASADAKAAMLTRGLAQADNQELYASAREHLKRGEAQRQRIARKIKIQMETALHPINEWLVEPQERAMTKRIAIGGVYETQVQRAYDSHVASDLTGNLANRRHLSTQQILRLGRMNPDLQRRIRFATQEQLVEDRIQIHVMRDYINPANDRLNQGRMPMRPALHQAPDMRNPRWSQHTIDYDKILVNFSKSGKAGDIFTRDLADELMKEADKRLQGVAARTGFKISLAYDDAAQGYRVKVSGGGQATTVVIPMLDQNGIYKSADGIPYTGKMSLLVNNELFADAYTRDLINKHRYYGVTSAHELALAKLAQLSDKIERDLVGKQDVSSIKQMIQRQAIDPHFENTSGLSSSLGDAANKSVTVESRIAGLMKDIIEDDFRHRQYSQGAQMIRKLTGLHAAGQRYFAVDSEFISPEHAMERGGRRGVTLDQPVTPYQVAGDVIDPNTRQVTGRVEYHAQLFSGTRGRTVGEEQLLADLTRFQSNQGGKSQAEIDALVSKLSRGELDMKWTDREGRLFHIRSEGGEASTRYLAGDVDLVRRGKGESLEHYYLRMQNLMLRHTESRFMVAQNAPAEHNVFRVMFARNSDLSMARALHTEQTLDTMLMAMAMHPNRTSSMALGSLAAAANGLSHDDYAKAVAFITETLATDNDTPASRQAALLRGIDDDARMKKAGFQDRKAVGSFFRTKVVPNLERYVGLKTAHDAAFDIIMSGQEVTFHMLDALQEGSASREGLMQTLEMVEAMTEHQKPGAIRNIMEAYSQMPFSDDGREATLAMMLVNQGGATLQQGSMLHPNILPFAALQNPSRQLYQKIKALELLDPVPTDNRTRGRRRFAGFGLMTSRQRILYGGADAIGEKFAFQAMGAVLPEDNLWVMGSRAQTTPEVARHLRTGQVRTLVDVTLDMAKLDEGFDAWVEGEKKFIKNGPVQQGKPKNALKSMSPNMQSRMKDMYRLKRLIESNETSMRMKLILSRKMRDEATRMHRAPDAPKAILNQLIEEAMGNDDYLRIGGRETLISPVSRDGIFHDRLIGPTEANAVAVDIRFTEETVGKRTIHRMSMDWIDDTMGTYKVMIGSHKVSSIGANYNTRAMGSMGEQFLVGASFESTKRQDHAGFVLNHLARLRRVATVQYANTTSEKDRINLLNRVKKAVKLITGATEVTNKHVQFLADGSLFVELTDELLAHPDRITTEKTEEAFKVMKHTYKHVLESIHQGLGLSPGEIRYAEATAKLKDHLRMLVDQTNKRIDEIQKELNVSGLIETEKIRLNNEHKFQRAAVSRWRKLLNGETLFADAGAIVDLHLGLDAEGRPVMSAAYQILEHMWAPQMAQMGGSELGNQYEALTGRVTLAKRISPLTRMLMSNNIQMLAPGGIRRDTANQFQDWIALRSGAAEMDNLQYQKELAEELTRLRLSGGQVVVNSAEKRVEYVSANGKVTPLTANPFKLQQAYGRAAVGFHQIGGASTDDAWTIWGRKLGIVKDITGMVDKDGALLFDRQLHAQRHFQFGLGYSPEDVTEEMRKSWSGNKFYYREGQLPFFMDESIDHLQIKLMADGIDGETLDAAAKALKAAGVSSRRIALLTGDEDQLVKALTHESGASAREEELLRKALNSRRTGGRLRPELLIPTMTNDLRPRIERVEGGYLGTHMNSILGRALDNRDAVTLMRTQISSIVEMAAAAGDDPAAQQQVAKVIGQLFEDTSTAANLEAVWGLRQENIRYLASQQFSAHRSAIQGFIGGAYKVSSTQYDFIPNLRLLQEKLAQGGGAFEKQIETMLVGNRGYERGTVKMQTMVQEAAETLKSYITTQQGRHGSDVLRWQGMAAGEGFVASSKVKPLVEEFENRLWTLSHPDSGASKAEIEAAKDSLALIQKELKNPGSTKGILGLSGRQPDFAAWLGWEANRSVAWSDAALETFGKDPHQVVAMSTFLSAWQQRGDYDFDLMFYALVDDPVLFKNMGDEASAFQGKLLKTMFDVMDEPNNFKFTLDPNNPSRVIYRDAVENTTSFSKSLAVDFAGEGTALGRKRTGRAARESQASQQALIGIFGAYSKRGAVEVQQASNAFVDYMYKLVDYEQMGDKQANILARLFGGHGGFESASGVKYANRWEMMKQTTNLMNNAHESGALNPLHRAMIGVNDVTQRVSIEKYGVDDAIRMAREMDDIKAGFFGHKKSSYQSFEDAWSGLERFQKRYDKLKFDIGRYFKAPGLDPHEQRAEAKRAFALLYDVRHSQQAATEKAGAHFSYLFDQTEMKSADFQAELQALVADYDGWDESAGLDDNIRSVHNAMRVITQKPTRAMELLSASLETHAATSLEPVDWRIGTLIGKMSPRAKGIAAASAAAMALLSLPSIDHQAERYDMPERRPQAGTSQHIAKILTAKQRAGLNEAHAGLRQGMVGRIYQAQRPPTQRGLY